MSIPTSVSAAGTWAGRLLCLMVLPLILGPTALVAEDQVVYGDSLLGGWQDWSWTTTHNVASTSPVHGGTNAIAVSGTQWQAVYLHHGAMSTAEYSALAFWVRGSGGQLLQVNSMRNDATTATVQVAALPAGSWSRVEIPLSTLQVADVADLTAFQIQIRGTGTTSFSLDDISLVGKPAPALVQGSAAFGTTLRTVNERHFAINTAVWDSAFGHSATATLLQQLGSPLLRFPGGSLSDEYHWQTGRSGTNTWTWATTFPTFASQLAATGCQGMITVNYGTGTATEAALWVQDANVTRGLGIRWWEVGNENYGSWEADAQSRAHDPLVYANRFHEYVTAMKAVDPSIKIGAVVVTGEDSYANYADLSATNPRTGVVHHGWTPVVLARLKQLGTFPDFLVHHRYAQNPPGESDAFLLSSNSTWADDAADLRQQLTDYLGSDGAAVELVTTENNSCAYAPGKQTTSLVNGLFLADSFATCMATEFAGLVWWDLRNGDDTSYNLGSDLYGWRQYGNYGITNGTVPPGPADTFPTFHALQLVSKFVRPGDAIVPATSDYNRLAIHGARRADGSAALLVINKHPSATLTSGIDLGGMAVRGIPTTGWSYGIPQDNAARDGLSTTGIASLSGPTPAIGVGGQGGTLTSAFAPYSITLLELLPNHAPSATDLQLPAFAQVGSSAALSVLASDVDSAVARVAFTIDGVAIGDGTFSGGRWRIGWMPSATSAATVVVAARAYDPEGLGSAVVSATLAVSLPPVPPSPPTIARLVPLAVVLPATATLAAVVADPNGLSLSTTWSQIAGPLAASVASPGQTSTPVAFPVDGVYRFRLTAGNGSATASATTTVIATLPGVQVVDNGMAGYSESGTWLTSGLTGLGGSDTRYASGAVSAAWTLAGPSGWQQVDVWLVGGNVQNTTAMSLRTEHAGGASVTAVNLATVASGWRTLGWFRRGDAPLRVVASSASGMLRADAVRSIALGGTIVDDASTGFTTQSGTWSASGMAGWDGGGTRFSPTVSSVARWSGTVTPVAGARGDVRLHWWRLASASNMASWMVDTWDGAVTLPWLVEARSGTPGWVDLGRLHPVSTSVTASIMGFGYGHVRADALRIAPLVVVDNGDPGYREEGAWGASSLTGMDGSTTRYSPLTGSFAAQWRAGLPRGKYRVWWWRVGHASNAPTADLSVSSDAGITPVSVDARAASGWVDLGLYTITSGDGQVRATRTGSGYLRADAVRWEPVADEVPVSVPAVPGSG